jgi:hypothetical protein
MFTLDRVSVNKPGSLTIGVHSQVSDPLQLCRLQKEYSFLVLLVIKTRIWHRYPIWCKEISTTPRVSIWGTSTRDRDGRSVKPTTYPFLVPRSRIQKYNGKSVGHFLNLSRVWPTELWFSAQRSDRSRDSEFHLAHSCTGTAISLVSFHLSSYYLTDKFEPTSQSAPSVPAELRVPCWSSCMRCSFLALESQKDEGRCLFLLFKTV